MEGHIKLYRKFLEWEWYTDINTKVLFVHMLLKANWKDGKFMGTTVPRGSFVSSIDALARETKLTSDEVRTAIKHLKKTNEITKQSTNKFTIFTVVNYASYQDVSQATPNQDPSRSQTITKLFPTIEEIKKEIKKEDNKNICASPDKKETERQLILEFFDRIWALYPIKRGKGAVSYTQLQKLYKIGYDEMKRAILRYCDEKKNTDKKFWKIGSTFFNSGYVDYLDKNYEGGLSDGVIGEHDRADETGLVHEAIRAGVSTDFGGFDFE